MSLHLASLVHGRRPAILAAVLASLITACSHVNEPSPPTYAVDIRRTDHGIPHIRASDLGSVGYGLAYAYAQDNACLLADQLLTVRGERSLWLGPDDTVTVAFRRLRNLDSDFYFALTQDDTALQRAWARASPRSRALGAGWVAGYNRFLRDTPRASLPAACRDAPWVRPMVELDLYRLLDEKATQASSGAFAEAIALTQAPAVDAQASASSEDPTIDLGALDEMRQRVRPLMGSNGWAFGAAATADGRGVLLGNPHFPWTTTNRFYQSHLTIPQVMDVMGASLGPFPVINIGFNHDVAWTHTVSTARRFTLFALTLVAGHPTQYLVDGEVHDMQSRAVTVMSRQPDGALVPVTRTFLSTPQGPAISLPQAGLGWTSQRAYVMADANRFNARMVDTWLQIAQSRSTHDVAVALGQLGIPWVNTIAADRAGHALYADISAVPHVPARQFADCAGTHDAEALFTKAGLLVLDGSRAACAWGHDDASPVPGLWAASSLPQLARSDYVANSNDSYWLANPAAADAEFAPILGPRRTEQNLRTRMGLVEIERLLACGATEPSCRITPEVLRDTLFAQHNLAARLVLEDLLAVARGSDDVDVQAAVRTLAAWDRSNGVDSRGAALFHEWWSRVRGMPALYRVAFNPDDPVHTPRGLRTADGVVASRSIVALKEAVAALRTAGFAADARLGDLQAISSPSGRVPVPGGDEREGVLNKIDVTPLGPDGYRPIAGSSYLQIVGFDADGPRAQGVLVHGQSSDPHSRHFFDQMPLFSQGRLDALPFHEAQIAARTRSTLHLTE